MALPIFSDMGEIQNQVRESEIRYALYRFSSALTNQASKKDYHGK